MTTLAFLLATLAASTPENLALGKSYTLALAPNYEHCTDPCDARQLTDGVRVDGYFWTQQGTVGWSGVVPARITLDLRAPLSGRFPSPRPPGCGLRRVPSRRRSRGASCRRSASTPPERKTRSTRAVHLP